MGQPGWGEGALGDWVFVYGFHGVGVVMSLFTFKASRLSCAVWETQAIGIISGVNVKRIKTKRLHFIDAPTKLSMNLLTMRME